MVKFNICRDCSGLQSSQRQSMKKGKKRASWPFMEKMVSFGGFTFGWTVNSFRLSGEMVLWGYRTTFVVGMVFRRGHPIPYIIWHVAIGGEDKITLSSRYCLAIGRGRCCSRPLHLGDYDLTVVERRSCVKGMNGSLRGGGRGLIMVIWD